MLDHHLLMGNDPRVPARGFRGRLNSRGRSVSGGRSHGRRHWPPYRTIVVCAGLDTATERVRRMDEAGPNVTRLLRAAASGERGDVDALMAAIYDDLRRLAIRHMQAERADHTLQPTALVHEAYLKLIDQHSADWQDRVHFFAVASRLIRRILVDHAREHRAAKRGGGGQRLEFEQVDLAAQGPGVDLVALDDALVELGAIDATQAQIVDMRYFGGLTIDEIAESLAIGKRSVDRHWQAAKAWLCFRLERGFGEMAGGS